MNRLLMWLKQVSRRLVQGSALKLADLGLVDSLPWTEVQSSHVRAVRYDGPERTLYVSFDDYAVYAYYNCPLKVAVEMLQSVSKGRFMWRQVRGRFVYLRVSPPSR